MALGTVIGSLAATAGSALISKAFSGGSKKAASTAKTAAQPNFTGGGLAGRFNPKSNTFNVTSTAARDDMIGQVSSTFGDHAASVRGLRDRVAPGVSDLRASRLTQVDNAKTAAIGNLRENLARRRVLGSSFASDAVTRAELEFGQEKQRVEAESFLQELQATHAFLSEEFELTRNSFLTKIGEMNLQADLASSLTQVASKHLSDAANVEMKLAAESSAGAGKFFGQQLDPVFKSIGGAIGNAIEGK